MRDLCVYVWTEENVVMCVTKGYVLIHEFLWMELRVRERRLCLQIVMMLVTAGERVCVWSCGRSGLENRIPDDDYDDADDDVDDNDLGCDRFRLTGKESECCGCSSDGRPVGRSVMCVLFCFLENRVSLGRRP